ncbi:MAG: cell division protein FtsZ [Paludibacteraceae bacterium]|nr:cell division protein FtsZ [Paludibacteraceae bacterium]
MEDLLTINDFQTTGCEVKVVGVGGGGGHSISHLYEETLATNQKISFLVCNTDTQDLEKSPVPIKLALGKEITHGNGCGAKPEVGRQAAEESAEDIKNALNDGARMVFVVAGMGGGTGTGASPVIAHIAKTELNMLTIGIVTLPFLFEFEKKYNRALEGIKKLKEEVDSIVIISNEMLFDTDPQLTLKQSFKKVDDVVASAAQSIADIVNVPGEINIDLADVTSIMQNSGVAIMNTGCSGKGSKFRLKDALKDALNTPILQNKKIEGAKNVLVNIYTSENYQLDMEETKYIREFLEENGINRMGEIIWGWAIMPNLEDMLKVTLIITGFEVEDIPEFSEEYDARYNARNKKKQADGQQTNTIEVLPEDDTEEDSDNVIDIDLDELDFDTAPSQR